MATYLKKFREVNGIKSKILSLVDVMCPVCHEIIIEPVLMPCSHGMCLECFESTVEKSNLSCPMCRKRLGSWLRSATKGKQLVNVKFWELIQKTFPDHVQAKLNGIESSEDVLFNNGPKKRAISTPGEIREEYEKSLAELQKREEAARKKREDEERASEAYIRNIQQEEAQRRQQEEEAAEKASNDYIRKIQEEEEKRRKEELNRSLEDQQLAKEMQQAASKQQVLPKSAGNKENKKGPLDQFLIVHRSLSNLSDCSHDSIVQETHHFFRPVKAYPKTPPKKLPGGRAQEVQLVRAKPRNLNQAIAEAAGKKTNGLFSSSPLNRQLSMVHFERMEQLRGGGPHSSAFSDCQPNERLTDSATYETPTKKVRTSTPSPGPSGSRPGPDPEDPTASDVERQREAERAILQERADLELAIILQKEFDLKDRVVDRRKGSSRAYDLRNHGDKRQSTLEEAFSGRRRARH